jgi:hypothetical protein
MSELNELADLITKTKESKKTKWIVGGIIVAFIAIAIIGFTTGRYNPDPNGAVVMQLIEKMKLEEKAKYDEKVLSIQTQLNQSQSINLSYQKEINNLNTKIKNIKVPQDIKEIRERLKVLGYETN